jgi:hypothetical protein
VLGHGPHLGETTIPCITARHAAHVRFGSLADIASRPRRVRFEVALKGRAGFLSLSSRCGAQV